MAGGKGKSWIQKGFASGDIKKGGLHKSLGIPEGQKIPMEKIREAAKGTGKVAKQARLALTFAKMRNKKG